MILEILMFTVRMAMFYCLTIYFIYFFVIIVFFICFSSCILSLLSYACAGTQLGGRCLLCGNYYKVCHQRDTYDQTRPVLQLLFSNYLQRLGRYGPKRCALLNIWWLMMMVDVVNILTMLIMNKIFFLSGCTRFTQYKMVDYEMLANLKMTKTFFQVMCVAQYKTRGGQASETTSKAPSSSASPTPR